MNRAPTVQFHPYEPQFAADPYPVYARLRESTPIFFADELGLTLFTRYDHIRQILIDGRFGRTLSHRMSAAELERERTQANWLRTPFYSRYVRVNLLEMEGAAHKRLRGIVGAALDPRRIRTLRSRIEALVERMLDEIQPRGQMDFVADLATPLPVFMIAELLGWPADERHQLRPWSARIVRLYEKDHTPEDEAAAETAAREFAERLHALADERAANPRDDLISALLVAAVDGERLTRDELIATCILLLNAGHEATVNVAGNGLLALMRHPSQWQRLCEQPTLMPVAVEEFVRYDAPLQLFNRYVLEDLEFEGVSFRRGEQVGLLYGSGNRDPRAFERPEDFEVTRQPNRHLGFGTGTHFCLGAPLARLELDVLFSALVRRLPTLHLQGEAPLHRTGLVFRSLPALHVSWS